MFTDAWDVYSMITGYEASSSLIISSFPSNSVIISSVSCSILHPTQRFSTQFNPFIAYAAIFVSDNVIVSDCLKSANRLIGVNIVNIDNIVTVVHIVNIVNILNILKNFNNVNIGIASKRLKKKVKNF